MKTKEPLIGKTLHELKDISAEIGLPGYAAVQISDWLYRKRVSTVDEMTNLSKSSRGRLSERFVVGREPYREKIISVDGTGKYLFPIFRNGGEKVLGIESVMIPDKDRYTLCVSSQPGCRMGCRFCMTGRQGYHGNLTTAEIINQYLECDESSLLTNTVFMGMGEPLDNLDNVLKAIEILTAEWGFGWSPKRITLSSIGINSSKEGIISPLKRFMDESSCHLAISLHDPFPEERAELMPMERAFPIRETIDLLRKYDFTGQRRVSFEYIMFSGINDTKRHADALAYMLRGIECRVNLIRFHKIPDSPLSPSPMPVIELFKKRLNDAGVVTTLRASRGEDILAACGMLSGRDEKC